MANVTTDQIRELREKTGAGIMECKRALIESGGKMEEALHILRVKGAKIADEKAGRAVRCGKIGSYIHGDRIGVLVEVNCETDFVARTEQFQKFVHEVCLQIAAMNPKYVSRDDVPMEEIGNELEILHEQLEGIDEESTQPMQQSHMEKFYRERVLLDQPYVKDGSKSMHDLLQELIASLRENVVISRFKRFSLGEETAASGTAQ